MNIGMVLVLAIAPGLFLLWFFYSKDKLEPEPKHLVIKTFLWGVFLAIPLILVQLPFLALPALIVYVVVAPVTEEIGKFLVVRLGVYRNREFDEPVDGIVYGTAAALGFASIENVFYLLGAYFVPGEIFDGATTEQAVWTLAAIRGTLSVPGHALWASFWGYALGVAKFAPVAQRRGIVANGLLVAIIAHALFNGLLFVPLLAVGVLVLTFVTWRMAFRRINRAIAASPHAVVQRHDRRP